jgi:hypothetical protein
MRPGWGFGDTNHVHTGPPGLDRKDGDDDGHGPGNGQTKGRDRWDAARPPSR